ncbi:NADPH-dependent glutamate synthase [Candidatus Saganbacteria bacterium]|nr:NADPH-dependent glutamate synthase [Candidatus Saganbacteria bacterium]
MAEKIPKQEMINRPATDRIKNFEEVPLGYTVDQAIAEANRCLQCKSPKCVAECPVEVDIPAFIKFVAKGDFESAVKKIKETNSLPAICGRVCPQEEQCEMKCIIGIKGKSVGIGNLERFVADWERSKLTPNPSLVKRGVPNEVRRGELVAVIGSGPSGLACAGDLAILGYQVTVFESLHVTGGVLTYGIPEFRLPKKIVDLEIQYVKSLGVEIKTDMLIGNVYTINDLLKEYKAVFIGSGAGLPKFMGIVGENYDGVYSANEFLFRVNMMKAWKFPEYLTPIKIGKRVAVVGGGNVAMDAARVSLRLGADEVYLIYRRTEKEMPARREEIHRAKEEGIIFKELTLPAKYHRGENGWITDLECIQMELGDTDSSGRRKPVEIKSSNFKIPIDTAVVAIGNSPNPLVPLRTQNLKTHSWGGIIITEDAQTSINNVYAGGDIVRGAATVISAMGDGKKAAKEINKLLSSNK